MAIEKRKVPIVMRLLIAVAVFSLLYYIFSHARQVSPTTTCLSNQRSLAILFVSYAQDHGERLPQQFSEINSSLAGDKSLLRCPLSEKAFHHTFGYGLNNLVAGQPFESIAEPTKILLTADSIQPGMQISTRADIDTNRHAAVRIDEKHGEAYEIEEPAHRGFIAGSVDGHAEFLTAGAKVSFQIASPKLKQF